MSRNRAPFAAVALGVAAIAQPAWAGLTVSPLIVDIGPGQPPRGDVELRNTGDERLFVVVEPARIEHPGRTDEKRVVEADPAALGLIATPNRLILQPGERKFVRLALLSEPGDADRVFRVVVKPVVGEVSSKATGLKLLVGYDMLVVQRPKALHGTVVAHREGDALVLTNTGDTNVELFHGKDCESGKASCADLPSQRIYAGGSASIKLPASAHAHYTVKVFGAVHDEVF